MPTDYEFGTGTQTTVSDLIPRDQTSHPAADVSPYVLIYGRLLSWKPTREELDARGGLWLQQ